MARAPVVGREQELFPSSDLSQLKPDLRASDVARAPMQAGAAPPHCALRRLTHGVRGQPPGPACCPHLGRHARAGRGCELSLQRGQRRPRPRIR